MQTVELSKDTDIQQRQVWLAAWLTAASCTNVYSTESATKWANNCLAAFNDKFPVLK